MLACVRVAILIAPVVNQIYRGKGRYKCLYPIRASSCADRPVARCSFPVDVPSRFPTHLTKRTYNPLTPLLSLPISLPSSSPPRPNNPSSNHEGLPHLPRLGSGDMDHRRCFHARRTIPPSRETDHALRG